MQCKRPVGLSSVLCGLFVLASTATPAPCQELHVRSTIEGEGGASWRVAGMDLEKSGHGLDAHLTITNISETAVSGVHFYAEYLDSRGRDCFSLIFAEPSGMNGTALAASFRPGETRILYAYTSSLFPALRPTAARIYVMRKVAAGDFLQTFDAPSSMDVPPIITGGDAEDTLDIDPAMRDQPYLGLASVAIDSSGRLQGSKLTNSAGREVGDRIKSFLGLLSFDPAIRNGAPAASRLLILFVPAHSPAWLSSNADWPWDLPWVRAAVAAVPETDAVPTVAELAFLASDDSSEPESKFKYLAIGTDWCLGLFTWTNDPATGRMTRVWK